MSDAPFLRLGVVGWRGYKNYTRFSAVLNKKIDGRRIEIHTGDATGADEMARLFAREHSLPLVVHEADWDTYRLAAGPLRNKKLVASIDELLAFQKSGTPGTKSVVNLARRRRVVVDVISIDQEETDRGVTYSWDNFFKRVEGGTKRKRTSEEEERK
jgi:YspA, cpYpsA-related SLOG family